MTTQTQLPPIPATLPKTQADWQNVTNVLQNWSTSIVNSIPQGVYQAAFGTGYVQYIGANGALAGNIGFEFGTLLPNPSGVIGPALLLGSGGGNGTPVSFWIIQDQAYDNSTPGNNLGITAGETQGAGVANGGQLSLYGGGSFGGTGGQLLLQGGTSLNGPGGITTVAGGNSTNGVPGNLFLIGGQNGTQGASVHLIMTELNGVPGSIVFRVNSTILLTMASTGALFWGATGAGLPGQPLVSGGPSGSPSWQTGYTGTITTAALSVSGTKGSMQFASGILIAQTQAT